MHFYMIMMLIQKTNAFPEAVNKKILVGSFARSCPKVP